MDCGLAVLGFPSRQKCISGWVDVSLSSLWKDKTQVCLLTPKLTLVREKTVFESSVKWRHPDYFRRMGKVTKARTVTADFWLGR